MPKSGRRRTRGRAFAIWGIRIGLVLVILGGWAYETRPGGVSPLLLPTIGSAFSEFATLITTSAVWGDIWVTVSEFLAAFGIATFAGLTIGFVLSRTLLRSQIAEPLLNFGYMVPLELFFPVVILWFGVGSPSKIFFGAIGGVFPVAINSLRAFRSVDPRFLRMARAYGATKMQSELQIKLPAALPLVLAGIRLGAALSLISVIVAEMLAAQRGIGYRLTAASQFFQSDQTYALILLLLLVVFVLHMAINRLDVRDNRRTRRRQANPSRGLRLPD